MENWHGRWNHQTKWPPIQTLKQSGTMTFNPKPNINLEFKEQQLWNQVWKVRNKPSNSKNRDKLKPSKTEIVTTTNPELKPQKLKLKS